MKMSAGWRMTGKRGRAVFSGGLLSVLLQLVAVLLVEDQVDVVGGNHATSQCVQIGQANTNHYRGNSPGEKNQFTYDIRPGPWTIGTRKFDTTVTFLDYLSPNKNTPDKGTNDCPYKNTAQGRFIGDPCPRERVEVRTYLVEQDGEVMKGWLHFEFELGSSEFPNDTILGVYVQIRDEFFNAIGEFVTLEGEQCQPSQPYLKQPTNYQILPCSAVGFREAKTSNAIFMADQSILRMNLSGTGFILEEPIGRGIHFTWRMSEYWCNRHLRIRPEAIIFTQKMKDNNDKYGDPQVYRKAAEYWLHPRWYGAADIKMPGTKMTCGKKAINYATGAVLQPSWFLNNTTKSTLENDYISPAQYYDDKIYNVECIRSCQDHPRKMDPFSPGNSPLAPGIIFQKDTIPTFSGRCLHHYEKVANHENLQGCNLDETAEEFKDLLATHPNLTTYTKYVGTLYKNRISLCMSPCRPPFNDTDLDEITNFTDHSDETRFSISTVFHEEGRNKTKVEQLMEGRKYHATLCTYWTLLLVPVGICFARYFKETCMSFTCTGAHLWFWVHVGSTVAATGLFISSIAAIWGDLENWGRNINPAGVAHRWIGWISIILFMLMIVLGGIRTINIFKRKILLTLHSAFGFLIYFLNLLAMITAGWIPASPSMGSDCDAIGIPKSAGKVFYVVFAWFIMDLIMHTLLTGFQCIIDKRHGIIRPWYCPIIPILPYNSADDLVGSFIRKMTMLAYGGAAFVMANTAIAIILSFSEDHPCYNLTGTSTCTDPWGCSAFSKAFRDYLEAEKKKNISGNYTIFEGSSGGQGWF